MTFSSQIFKVNTCKSTFKAFILFYFLFEKALPVKDVKEKRLRTKETVRLPSSTKPRLRPSALLARRSRKAAKNPQRSSSKIRENKHPFALYGWGEKQTDTGSQKTHNVCASAPVHEIHESALRTRNRRQVEKRRLVAQRQSTHSADMEKNRRRPPPSLDNPWMTGYMRRYSARLKGRDKQLL
ncbi:Centriole; cilia and spindle-associated protein [Camelus dromedarius]|uniref:Centriole n=1 Tax=Camelus dromedarius TaxID=9838 RepID=A0A5N4C4W8_CAMDR|nr:centriole, cilia and spindle-associated protein-like [Camelus dromedarius]KAB1253921.1 Centriole; cilia and spindle-associated protein [Camelus dromedarius]